MSLTLQNKVDIRRHLGVPAAGYPTSGYTGGIRTVQTTGQLEYYMNALQAEEEAVLTGNPYGQVLIFGTPMAGDTLDLNVNGTDVLYTVTSNDQNSKQPAPLQAVAYNAATALNQSNLGPTAAGGFNWGATVPIQLPDKSQITVSNAATFALTAQATGHIACEVIANGAVFPNPQLVVKNPITGAQETLYGWIQICNFLEGQVVSPNLSLRYIQADVVKFRPDETRARLQNYRWACQQMGNFLSVGLEAGMLPRIGNSSAIRVKV